MFPDYPAPVVRNVGSEREMVLMRWGMPPPPRTGAMVNTDMSNGNMRGACTHYMIAQRIQDDVRDPFGNLHFEWRANLASAMPHHRELTLREAALFDTEG